MSAAKHTPGPWVANVGQNGHVMTEDGCAIADCCLDYSSIEWAAQLKNACLIASAPDLLAAVLELETVAIGDRNRRIIRAAIAKATGGTA